MTDWRTYRRTSWFVVQLTLIAAAPASWLMVTTAHTAGLQFIELAAGAGEEGRKLTGAVWYPCAAPVEDVKISELLVVRAAVNCPVEGKSLPIIVLSHGRRGNYFLHRDLAVALAEAGFLVAAIAHPGDSSSDSSRSDDLAVLVERPTDIKRLIDYMLVSWASAPTIDKNRIGLFGFSRGGYTGLVAIGAEPDLQTGFAFCAINPEPICKQVAAYDRRKGFTHDKRIRAAVLVDPALSRLFPRSRLQRVKIPVQLWASAFGGDGVSREGVDRIAKGLGVRPVYEVPPNSRHFSFATPCTAEQAKALPEICDDAPGFDRVAFHENFNAAVVAFFRKHLSK